MPNCEDEYYLYGQIIFICIITLELMFKIQQHTKSAHNPTRNFNSATHSNQFNFKSNAKMH